MYPGSVGAVKTKQTTNLIILSTLENFGVNWVCVFIQQLTQRSSTWRMLAAQLPHTGTLLYRQVDGILLWLPLLLLSLFYWCHVFSKHTEVPSCCFHIYLNLECMKSPDTVCVCVCAEAAPTPLFTADRVQTPHVSAQYQPPPSQAASSNGKNQSVRAGKENICVPGGGGGGGEARRGDPYEGFARAERSRKEKKRPEWNTQRYNHSCGMLFLVLVL